MPLHMGTAIVVARALHECQPHPALRPEGHSTWPPCGPLDRAVPVPVDRLQYSMSQNRPVPVWSSWQGGSLSIPVSGLNGILALPGRTSVKCHIRVPICSDSLPGNGMQSDLSVTCRYRYCTVPVCGLWLPVVGSCTCTECTTNRRGTGAGT